MSRRAHYPTYERPRAKVDGRCVPSPRKGKCPNAERDRMIVLRVVVGWETLTAVAKDQNPPITRERVRQIVNRVVPADQRVNGNWTLVTPNSDPLVRRSKFNKSYFRNRPLRKWRLARRETKNYAAAHRTRLRLLKTIGDMAAARGHMPTIKDLGAVGIYAATIQHSFSGVRCYRTAIRRVARLIGGYEARPPGHPGNTTNFTGERRNI